MNVIALVPLGGTNVNWESAALGAAFQLVISVVMLNNSGIPVSVTTYFRGNGAPLVGTQT